MHGSGLDEIALHGDTQVIEIKDGQLLSRTLSPADFGLENHSLEAIKGGTPQENADIIKAILSGAMVKSAHNAAVIINCAALLYLHDKANTLQAAAQLAREVLDSGKGLRNTRETCCPFQPSRRR